MLTSSTRADVSKAMQAIEQHFALRLMKNTHEELLSGIYTVFFRALLIQLAIYLHPEFFYLVRCRFLHHWLHQNKEKEQKAACYSTLNDVIALHGSIYYNSFQSHIST